MQARITINGSDIFGDVKPSQPDNELRIPLLPETLTQLKTWTEDYHSAVKTSDPLRLQALGTTIFNWLDQGGWASRWARGVGDRILQIAMDDSSDPIKRDAADALLDLPWEILVYGNAFLAADSNRLFIVERRMGQGPDSVPKDPAYRNLTTMFMAASPQGQVELDFEAEEAAILSATERLPMQLFVEESGCRTFLEERLAAEGPFEAVHLSCHGDISFEKGPILLFENPYGREDFISPGELARVLGETKPLLVFLSACRTAEGNQDTKTDTTPPEAMEPYARGLIRSGVPNVLGWDGSVMDADATLFARSFYRRLAEFSTVPYAAAAARKDLFTAHQADARNGRHWHLARVYSGLWGGGALCARKKAKRKLIKDVGYKEFLDPDNKRVPVASAPLFVGRRRQAQTILRLLQDPKTCGVLIHGMGNLGKSSLAARIANRLPGYHTVVIYDRYDALEVFDRLLAALDGSERGKWNSEWRDGIKADPTLLGDALEDMLEDHFDDPPLLLIIDDLEQILETPRAKEPATPVKGDYRDVLSALIKAFKAAQGHSKLLVTSRYAFTLPDGRGRDLAASLSSAPLIPMTAKERSKQWQAARRAEENEAESSSLEKEHEEKQANLIEQILNTAGGNPGLQEILCRPVLTGELELAQEALDTVKHWKRSGKLPQDNSAAQEFFQRVSFDIYRNALLPSQLDQLQAATLFAENLPVPRPALVAAGKAAGINHPSPALDRLTGLGLVDLWGDINGCEHLAANPLARPLVERLSAEEEKLLAGAAFLPLANAWQDEKGDFPISPNSKEAARLALLGDAPVDMLEKAALAGGYFLFECEHNAKAALGLMTSALVRLDAEEWPPMPNLIRLAADCAKLIGKVNQQISLLEKGLTLSSDDTIGLTQITVEYAMATIAQNPEKAIESLKKAAAIFKREKDERSCAMTMGKIADILNKRGEANEALCIRYEEELPVYERLEEVREKAVTMGKIADILTYRGQIDEALRIRYEEELPIYERLGDVRSKAVAMGKIADILSGRGQTEEALRIRYEEELPVYERLGDVCSKVLTMGKIADILTDRGQTSEAMLIYLHECLPVLEALQYTEGIAHVRYSCAWIRIYRGGLTQGELQTIFEELTESFAINSRLQRIDGIAHSGMMLGQILYIQGKKNETLAVLDQSAAAFETLTLFEQAEQVRSLQEQIKKGEKLCCAPLPLNHPLH